MVEVEYREGSVQRQTCSDEDCSGASDHFSAGFCSSLLRRSTRSWSIKDFSHGVRQEFRREWLLEKTAGSPFMTGEDADIVRKTGHEQDPKFRLDRNEILGQFSPSHARHHHVGKQQ